MIARPSPERPGSPAVVEGRYRVLIADDGRNAAEILSMFFQMEGMDTEVAFDGLQAVDAAQRFVPNLVCMDLHMPNMDGYEAARRIRQTIKEVVIVALSGWDGEEERRRSAEAGFDLHLVKPVKPDDLREVIARYLHQDESQAGVP